MSLSMRLYGISVDFNIVKKVSSRWFRRNIKRGYGHIVGLLSIEGVFNHSAHYGTRFSNIGKMYLHQFVNTSLKLTINTFEPCLLVCFRRSGQAERCLFIATFSNSFI